MNRATILLGSSGLLVVAGFLWWMPHHRPAKPADQPARLALVPGTAPSRPIALPPSSPSPSPTPAIDTDMAAYRASLSTVSQEVAPMIAEYADMKSYHDRLRGEGRDKAWATRSEAMLRAEIARMPGMDKGRRPIAINCGTTLCEIAGDLADADRGVNGQRMSSVGDAALQAMLWRRGYHSLGTTYGPGRTGDAFVSYYQREAPIDVQAPPRLPPDPG